jgi:hypothetical protein
MTAPRSELTEAMETYRIDSRRPRAADDFAALGPRLAALKRGCSCSVHRGADGDVLSVWSNPECPLHGECTPGYATQIGDPGCLACEAIADLYRARTLPELSDALERLLAATLAARGFPVMGAICAGHGEHPGGGCRVCLPEQRAMSATAAAGSSVAFTVFSGPASRSLHSVMSADSAFSEFRRRGITTP